MEKSYSLTETVKQLSSITGEHDLLHEIVHDCQRVETGFHASTGGALDADGLNQLVGECRTWLVWGPIGTSCRTRGRAEAPCSGVSGSRRHWAGIYGLRRSRLGGL